MSLRTLEAVTIECERIEDRTWIAIHIGGKLAAFLEDWDAMGADELHLRTEYLKGEWEHLTPTQVAEKLWPTRKRQRPR